MHSLIEINNLVKSYHQKEVVAIPKLEIKAGECIGLVGNNGAGKTTLFRMMLDLIRPQNGEVLIKGENVQKTDTWKAFTGSYIDTGFLIDFLTSDEYFDFIGDMSNLSKGDVDDFLVEFNEIFNDEIRGNKKYLRDLSKGNQKKVGIVSAMMIKPEILILDEPFANLDPSTQIRFKNHLNKLKEKTSMAILISSHDLNHIIEVCDRVLIMDKGKITHDLNTTESTLQELQSYFTI